MTRMRDSQRRCCTAAVVILCLGLPSVVHAQATEPQEPPPWLLPWKPPVVPDNYVSPGDTHKLDIKGDSSAPAVFRGQNRPVAVFDYDQQRLLLMKGLPPDAASQLTLRDDLNLIRLRDHFFDTTMIEPDANVPAHLRLDPNDPNDRNQLHLVQFAGPPLDEWLENLRQINDKELGRLLEIVSYLPENAYLVWANRAARDELAKRIDRHWPEYFQWQGSFHPAYKLHPGFDLDYPGNVQATIQLFYLEESDLKGSLGVLEEKATSVLQELQLVGRYANISVEIPARELVGIACRDDVVNIEPYIAASPLCERQCQILAGNLDATGTGPAHPGYLQWLDDHGFTPNFDFVVDVADTGFDRGETGAANAAQVHPVFRDANGLSRIAYVRRINGKSAPLDHDEDTDGHGTINASIVGGFLDGTLDAPDFPSHADAGGFLYGLGIAPYVRIGATDLFWRDGRPPDYTTAIDYAYRDGARISSNSWGDYWGSGKYDGVSQRYDYLVRDARPAQVGNQEMVVVFAAGNSGPGLATLGNQGATAKNTIVVGASENYNPAGENDGGWTPMGDQEANNADEVVLFSSRGPTLDGRTRPDIMAPGTHVFGSASQDPNYDGYYVAGAPGNHATPHALGAEYYPPGQKLYTWSSGTSHAAPAVAGGAALLRQWFINKGLVPPSPAMTKAYLMNSATYMKGPGDDLPSVTQGMGRMDLGRAFDDTPRVLRDQTRIFYRTATGADDSFTIDGRIVDPNRPFRVTMAYTDAPGTPLADKVLQNDLDLDVYVNNQLYRGNDFNLDVSRPGTIDSPSDHDNNVESVFLPAGTTGNFTIVVRPSSIVANAWDPFDRSKACQDFALVIYNAEATTEGPVDVVLVLDLSGSMNQAAPGGATPKIDLLKDAVEMFIRAWEPFSLASDRLGIVFFNNAAQPYSPNSSGSVLAPFRKYADKFVEHVRKQTASGCAALGGGILTALRSFDHPSYRQRHVIVVTNDMQNRSPMVTSVYPTTHQILADPEAPCGASGVPDEPGVGLNEYDIKAIHTVGTGTPGDWANLLVEIASETAGQCRFTTTPDTDLEGFLLETLAATLQFDPLAYAGVATGTLLPGQTARRKVFPINSTVRRATFVVSWTGVRDPNAVNVGLQVPDGGTVPPDLIDLRRGPLYQTLSVAFPLSGYPHMGDWTVALESRVQDGPAIDYRIRSLVDDDSIRCHVSVPTANLRAGELIPISVSLQQGNRVLRGLQNVQATISRPPEGFGTFMVNNRLSAIQLRTPVDLAGDVFPNRAQRQAYLLLQDDRLRKSLAPVTETIRLYDNGQFEHGDARRGDGVFSALYGRTSKPGLYHIELSVRYEDGQDIVYRKESRTLAVKIGQLDPDKSTIAVRRVEDSPGGESSYYEVAVTYVDRFGNYLGPGHDDLTATMPDPHPDKWNVKRVPLHDNLDGSYSGWLGPVVHRTGVASPPDYVRIEMGGGVIGETKLLYTR